MLDSIKASNPSSAFTAKSDNKNNRDNQNSPNSELASSKNDASLYQYDAEVRLRKTAEKDLEQAKERIRNLETDSASLRQMIENLKAENQSLRQELTNTSIAHITACKERDSLKIR